MFICGYITSGFSSLVWVFFFFFSSHNNNNNNNNSTNNNNNNHNNNNSNNNKNNIIFYIIIGFYLSLYTLTLNVIINTYFFKRNINPAALAVP